MFLNTEKTVCYNVLYIIIQITTLGFIQELENQILYCTPTLYSVQTIDVEYIFFKINLAFHVT